MSKRNQALGKRRRNAGAASELRFVTADELAEMAVKLADFPNVPTSEDLDELFAPMPGRKNSGTFGGSVPLGATPLKILKLNRDSPRRSRRREIQRSSKRKKSHADER